MKRTTTTCDRCGRSETVEGTRRPQDWAVIATSIGCCPYHAVVVSMLDVCAGCLTLSEEQALAGALTVDED